MKHLQVLTSRKSKNKRLNSTRLICALEKKAHLKEHRIRNLKPRELVQRRLGEKDLVAVFGIAFPQEAHREARVELIKAALVSPIATQMRHFFLPRVTIVLMLHRFKRISRISNILLEAVLCMFVAV